MEAKKNQYIVVFLSMSKSTPNLEFSHYGYRKYGKGTYYGYRKYGKGT